jgi:L-amino acid N-acyltransferase YncA
LGNISGACGYRVTVKQDSRSGQGGPAHVKITAGTEDALPAIVGILNYTAANSIARFETRPVSVAERRDWKYGFTEVGTFREYAIKNGQYISSVWMQRACRPAPPPRQQSAP